MESIEQQDKKVPEIKTLQNLIDELHEVFSEDCVDVDYVKELLESYKSSANDWKKFVNFDAYRYTRNLVDEGNGKFNLILLCWGEGHCSRIHDHSDAHCFVKILAGHLKETMYEFPNGDISSPTPIPASSSSSASPSSSEYEEFEPMRLTETHWYAKDQVTYINDEIGLHRVENPSHSDRAISLHLYSPPFEFCNLFDERTGQKRKAKMTFWSRNGQLNLDDPGFTENSLQPRPLRGLLSKIGC